MNDGSTDPFAAFRLDGRVAIVTGASSGLGVAIARALAAAGARVAVVARRRDRLEALAGEIGGGAGAFACDLLDDVAIQGVVPAIADALGPPEILVNAAGGIDGIHKAEVDALDSIQRTIQLDLVAPYRLAQLVFPHMRAVGRGSIVNISSISGHVGIQGIPQASYAAAKTGLSGLTRELAVQWARHSIRVNTVAPGFFRSEITAESYDDPRQVEWLRSRTPLPIDGTPEDCVGAVQWLVSDAGRYTTGQTIIVDGGWTVR
jgi:NAD(P)-dependent dehydrogenase (short-subunit alcohol dehydrogenase family)